MSRLGKKVKREARIFFKKQKFVNCPAFPKEKILFNSKGVSHLFYTGAQKRYPRPFKESKTRISLLSLAVRVLELLALPQEESVYEINGQKAVYWAFEAVIDNKRIKVIVRKMGNGAKHFWSVIPAWRKARGTRVNAKGIWLGNKKACLQLKF